MTSRFHRVALGYPVPELMAGYCVLAQNQSLQATLTTGPGEFAGVIVWTNSALATIFYNMWILVVADGVNKMNSYFTDYVLIPPSASGHGLFSTNDVLAADVATCCLFMPIQYELSCVVTLTNTVAGNLNLVYSILNRHGA